jgi:hypothetical protein
LSSGRDLSAHHQVRHRLIHLRQRLQTTTTGFYWFTYSRLVPSSKRLDLADPYVSSWIFFFRAKGGGQSFCVLVANNLRAQRLEEKDVSAKLRPRGS